MMKTNAWIMTVVTLFCAAALSAQHVPNQVEQRISGFRRYTVIDLGTLGGTFSFATGISNNGLVDGFSNLQGDTEQHAFLWNDGTMIDLGAFGGPNSGVSFWGRRPNERGEIAGAAQTSDPDPLGEDYCAFINNFFSEPPAPFVCHPFVWQDGVLNALPTLEGNGNAAQINSRGQVAGQVDGKPDCPLGTPHPIPVVWENGVLHKLPRLPGDPYSGPNAINDKGQSVGVSVEDCAGSIAHAVLWEGDNITYLGNLGGTAFDEAADINNNGEVVGFSSLSGNTVFHAFSWTKGKGMQDLGTLPGDLSSIAVGVNGREQIVGFSCPDAGCMNTRAFVLQNGVMTDLNRLVSGSSLYLVLAFDINSRGQIVGLDFDNNTQQAHAYLATPCGDEQVNDESCKGSSEADVAARRLRVVLPENIRQYLQKRLRIGSGLR